MPTLSVTIPSTVTVMSICAPPSVPAGSTPVACQSRTFILVAATTGPDAPNWTDMLTMENLGKKRGGITPLRGERHRPPDDRTSAGDRILNDSAIVRSLSLVYRRGSAANDLKSGWVASRRRASGVIGRRVSGPTADASMWVRDNCMSVREPLNSAHSWAMTASMRVLSDARSDCGHGVGPDQGSRIPRPTAIPPRLAVVGIA